MGFRDVISFATRPKITWLARTLCRKENPFSASSMLGYLRLHVRVTLCTTQAVEEQLTYTINKWTEVISHCAYHENGLTSFERISYNSLSVKSPSGYASVFKGIPNYATRIRSDKAEPRVLTKYSATHSTADALMTSCTISTVVP